MAGVRATPAGTGRYQGWYKNHDGRRVYFTGTTSRQETRRIAADLEDEARKITLGYVEAPTTAAKHRGRAFAETAAEYLAWGKAQGGRGGRPWGPGHAHMRQTHLDWWKQRLGLETLADLDGGLLARAEAALRELGAEVRPEGQKGAGTVRTGKTLANTAESLSAFCRWAVGRGYLDKNPLDGLAGFDTTPQTRRRAFTPEELARLIGAAPAHRQLLYKVAVTSGLRANELRSLAPRHLDRERRGLLLEAAWTKGRRDDFQPMPGAVFADLLAAAEGRGDNEPLLRLSGSMMNVMDGDLERAGIAKHGRGGKVDFHSLRVTYTSLVIEAGASGKEAMSLARHTTPNLTFNVYGRARDERLAGLAESVGAVALAKVGAGESEAVCATGVHKLAAGAEGTSHIPFDDNELGQAVGAEKDGFKSRWGHHLRQGQPRTRQVCGWPFCVSTRTGARGCDRGDQQGRVQARTFRTP
ncbi:MAG TPA: tyrosine-type recombinase/integrase [Candidatus Brocadiia bacterium]|nr:tyrosine-type recombinase/integrase [Candidatus Brocadiia bacterium]